MSRQVTEQKPVDGRGHIGYRQFVGILTDKTQAKGGNMMHRLLKNHRLGIALVMVFVLMTTIACSPQGSGTEEGSAASSGELTIYTALPDTEVPVYFNAFEQETGIKVNYIRLSAGEILTKLQVERNNPQASVWHGGPIDTFIAAINEDLLEPYTSPEIENVPEEYVDPSGHWSPFYVGALGFAVSNDWFTEMGMEYPQSWDDLLKPEFQGEISMAHPGSSGTAYTVLSTILQLKGEEAGWEYFRAFNQNIRQYTKSGSAPAQNVALGEAAIGIVFAHDGLKPSAQGYPVEVVFPTDGTGYEVGGLALIKNAPAAELENAKKFIDWTMSKAGQELFEDSESFRLPVNKLAAPPTGAISIGDLRVIEYDFDWAGENRVRLLEEFTAQISDQENLQ